MALPTQRTLNPKRLNPEHPNPETPKPLNPNRPNHLRICIQSALQPPEAQLLGKLAEFLFGSFLDTGKSTSFSEANKE